MAATPSTDASSSVQPRTADRSIVLAAKGGGVTFLGTVFAFGTRFLIGLLLARILGAEQYGLYALAFSTIEMVAGGAGLGLNPALVRYVSVFAGRRDEAGLWGTLQVGLGLSAIASLVAGVGLFILAPPIAERVFSEPRLVPLLRLGGLLLPFMTVGNALAAATRGFKTMQYMVISQKISQPIIRLVVTVAFAVALGLTALNALAAHVVAAAIVFGMLLFFLNHLFSLRRPLKAGRRNLGEMAKFSLPVYVTSLIESFSGNIQTFVLGGFHSVTTVGLFSVASRTNLVSRMFRQSLGIASGPIISELHDQHKGPQLARFYQTTTKWTLTANLPLFLIIQLFPAAILSIFGREYVGGATALTILAWGNLVDAGTGNCGVVIDMTGKTGLKLANATVALGLLIGLNFLLTPRWGLLGAATAAASGNAMVNLLRLVEVYVLYRMLPYNVTFLKPVAAGLAALAAGWILRQWVFTEETFLFMAISMAILLITFAATIVLLGLDEEDRAVLNLAARRFRARLRR